MLQRAREKSRTRNSRTRDEAPYKKKKGEVLLLERNERAPNSPQNTQVDTRVLKRKREEQVEVEVKRSITGGEGSILLDEILPTVPDTLSVESFTYHKVLGQGHFGKVLFVSEKVSGHHLAIQIVKKRWLCFLSGYTRLNLPVASSSSILEALNTDLKPSNIFIDSHVRIGDFGLVDMNVYEGQKVSGYAGTRRYMAPEVSNTSSYVTVVTRFPIINPEHQTAVQDDVIPVVATLNARQPRGPPITPEEQRQFKDFRNVSSRWTDPAENNI
ncbi:unnamed protein product [Ranitomeya imitator]|uniref:Protein kinase domain-containing protein n=1 Tax=Ranitomeya imitator TaxID=111125 RepID=A0ABN9MPZ4_9NEOB|nr:unnamed protein product [Ranitomeya imitator]